MGYICGVAAILLILLGFVIVAKAIRTSALYLDDSFRWGGRDD
jgi:hypothetical protein